MAWFSSKKISQIQRDTRRLAIVDSETHNKMSDQEKMANLLKAEMAPIDKKFTFFSSGNDYKIHNKKISLSVEANIDSYFKLDFPEKSNREYFQITLFCPLWIPARTNSNAIMTLYMKDSAHSDPAKQRTLLGRFPVRKVTSIVWRMSHHIAVSDSDHLSLHINLEELDLVNTVMGTLKLAYVIRYADECLPSEPIDPGMTVFSHYREKDYTGDVTAVVVQELIDLYESKHDDFAASFKRVVDKIGSDVDKYEIDTNDYSSKKRIEDGRAIDKSLGKTENSKRKDPLPFEMSLLALKAKK